MSFLVHCLLVILYLHASTARHIGINKDLYDQKYHILGKGMVRDHVDSGKHQDTLSPFSTTISLFDKEEDSQGNGITSFPQVVIKEAEKIEEWKGQARRMLLDPKPHDAEETVDSKENDAQIVEDVVVMDYAQPHRKQPIHNRDP